MKVRYIGGPRDGQTSDLVADGTREIICGIPDRQTPGRFLRERYRRVGRSDADGRVPFEYAGLDP